MGLSGAAIGTYRPQYRPISVICYLDTNPLPTRYTLRIVWALVAKINFATHFITNSPSSYSAGLRHPDAPAPGPRAANTPTPTRAPPTPPSRRLDPPAILSPPCVVIARYSKQKFVRDIW